MSTLSIHNPATGELITELPADDAASVRRKLLAAGAAQPVWAARPLDERKASKAGRLMLARDSGSFITVQDGDGYYDDELVTVFEDGSGQSADHSVVIAP